MFTYFFDICHKHIYDYIKFGQLSVKECVNYEQCLNSLRTAIVQLKILKHNSVFCSAFSHENTFCKMPSY